MNKNRKTAGDDSKVMSRGKSHEIEMSSIKKSNSPTNLKYRAKANSEIEVEDDMTVKRRTTEDKILEN